MLTLLTLSLLPFAIAEDGLQAWLRYAPLPHGHHPTFLPSRVIALNESSGSPVFTAGQEAQIGLKSIFGHEVDICHSGEHAASSVIIATLDQYRATYDQELEVNLLEDGFWLSINQDTVTILGQNERGALYGTYEYLSMLAQGNFSEVEYGISPAAPIRWTNEWDNMDGSIERGFAGASIFFNDGRIVTNLTRAAEYARLLASIRVNAVVVNNVSQSYL